MLNDVLILQTLSVITLSYFVSTFNILTIWYLAGLYLVQLGWLLLLDDGDIFVGFLWVIDLGVGLIFFMFILHYSTFLHQKSNLQKSSREFSFTAVALIAAVIVLFFSSTPVAELRNSAINRIWFLLASWYDYFDFFFSATVTDLNLLHEIYFRNNSFEFFLINFFLLYGVVASILMSFLVKRIFNLLNFSQLSQSGFLQQARATYFIRSQDYIKQQSMSAGTRVWLKKKNTKV